MRWLIWILTLWALASAQSSTLKSGDFSLNISGENLVARFNNKILWKTKVPMSGIAHMALHYHFITIVGEQAANVPMIGVVRRSNGHLLWKAPISTRWSFVRLSRLEVINRLVYASFATGGEPAFFGNSGFDLETGEAFWDDSYNIARREEGYLLLVSNPHPAISVNFFDSPRWIPYFAQFDLRKNRFNP